MNIEKFYSDLPVYHIDTNKQMKVKQVMPAGNIKCTWTDPEGEVVDQLFWPQELEVAPLKIGDNLIIAL